jgi:hypothetical protein
MRALLHLFTEPDINVPNRMTHSGEYMSLFYLSTVISHCLGPVGTFSHILKMYSLNFKTSRNVARKQKHRYAPELFHNMQFMWRETTAKGKLKDFSV